MVCDFEFGPLCTGWIFLSVPYLAGIGLRLVAGVGYEEDAVLSVPYLAGIGLRQEEHVELISRNPLSVPYLAGIGLRL